VSFVKSPQGHYISTLLAGLEGVDHAFGTAAVPPLPGYLTLHQVHSARILHASECSPAAEGDALFTSEQGVFVGVKTADCVPLLLYDPVRRVVAAVHSGWRGTVLNIASGAVARLGSSCGSKPVSLHAAIGPSIGGCCFEVGPEVGIQFRNIFPERSDLGNPTTVDLREAVRRQLVQAGVPAAQIDADAPCTFCGGTEFYSWRRDRIQGQRMFAVIGLKTRR